MSATSATHLCPLSPALDDNEGEGWDNLEDADVLADVDPKSVDIEADDDVDADDGSETQSPIGLPEPPLSRSQTYWFSDKYTPCMVQWHCAL